MNKTLLVITITIIATIIVLISAPNSQKNVQFASRKLGFKNTSAINKIKTNNSYTNIKKEKVETKSSESTNIPKIEKKIVQQSESQLKEQQENSYIQDIEYIDWSEWRELVHKKIRGRFAYANKKIGWGIGAITDKNGRLLESYCYYIPESSMTIEETDWWLEANKPFYIYIGSNYNIYEAINTKRIKPTPTNLEEIIKNIVSTKKVYGADIAQQAYDDYYAMSQNNNQYVCKTCTKEQSAFSNACSSSLYGKDNNSNYKEYKNKHTESQRQLACIAMNMHAEASSGIKKPLKKIKACLYFQ